MKLILLLSLIVAVMCLDFTGCSSPKTQRSIYFDGNLRTMEVTKTLC